MNVLGWASLWFTGYMLMVGHYHPERFVKVWCYLFMLGFAALAVWQLLLGGNGIA